MTCVEVVLRPRAIWVDWSWMSLVVRRLVEIVEAERVERPATPAWRVEAVRLETVSWDVILMVEPVMLLAWRVEPFMVEKPMEPEFSVEVVMEDAERPLREMELV